MTTWWPARRRLAAIAVLTATLTGAAVAALGASGWHIVGAGVYVVIAATALFFPAAITIQVIGGQMLAGSVLLGQNAPASLLLLPVIASVVVTAELLAAVGRLDTPLERHPGGDLQRAGFAAVVAGAVFGAVALIGDLPGPSGLVAIIFASAACVALAILMVSSAHE